MTIQGQYRGFLLQARRWDGSSQEPVGTFTSFPSGVKPLTCSVSNDALTHNSGEMKSDVTVQWIPPTQDAGSVVFVATVVLSKEVYWVDVYSKTVTGQRYRGRLQLETLKKNQTYMH